MVEYPTGFLADLRSSRTWPSLEGSLWRAPYLARSTFGHAWELIHGLLPSSAATILEVGSGTGFLSLELARAGHRVVALDTDEEALAVAAATLDNDRRAREAVTYHRCDVADWSAPRASFDVVVVSRVLHHLDDPRGAVADMRRWLRPDGRLVCLDFAYDRFDHRSARWLALVRSLLEAVDAYDTTDLVIADPPAAADQVLQDWLRDHSEHDLRTWHDMASALDAQFVRDHLSWHPYLYWEVLADLRVPTPAIEEQLAATVMQWEQLWLAEREIPGVLFLFAGSPRP